MASTPPVKDEGAERRRLIGPGTFVRHRSGGGPVGVVLEVMESEDLRVFWICAGRMFSIEPEAWFRPV